jgi:hypothetical protein
MGRGTFWVRAKDSSSDSAEKGGYPARARAFQFRVVRGIFRVRGKFDIYANDPNEGAACQ